MDVLRLWLVYIDANCYEITRATRQRVLARFLGLFQF